VTGIGIIAASLLAATVVAGVGFASGSVSAAQYQYGKVTICHHTHSKKHPFVTITVSQHAWAAHQRHGDTLGPCSPATTGKNHGKGHGNGHGKGKGHGNTPPAPTTTTTTTTSTPPAPGNGHGNGNGNGQGHKK
jgi:hypothetical protein